MSLESSQVAIRSMVAVMAVTGTTLVGIAGFEGYRDKAYIPVPGDRPTIGYGSTAGVKMGDTITPDRALHRLMDEVDTVYAQGVRRCVMKPLTQNEFGAFVSLAYSVGVPTFCRKARKGQPPNLIDLINAGEYDRACERIEAFVCGPGKRGVTVDKCGEDKKIIRGLQNRRRVERAICEGRQ